MIIFMAVFVLLMNILQVSGAEDDDVLYFEDIQSDQPGEDWEKLPLISQTRTKTDWCEVTPAPAMLCHHCAFHSGGGGGGGDQRDGW